MKRPFLTSPFSVCSTIALIALFCLNGCGRHSDTNDPTSVPDESGTKAMETPISLPEESGDILPICTPAWFIWVNDQVQSLHNGDLAELYPGGLPQAGSNEWFLAIDKLTGGDGAHGPDGGSAEWCSMIRQRLQKPDSSLIP